MAKDKLEDAYRGPLDAYRADPSPANTGALLKAIDPVLRLGVRTYGGGDSPLVHSRARQIALGALPGYDPARASLKTHLMPHLQGLQRYATRLQQPLSVPEAVLLDHRRLYASFNELQEKLGREPSDSELSDHARMSRKRIAYVRQYRPAALEGEVQGRYLDTLGGDEGSVNDPAVLREDPVLEYAEAIYHDLDPRDQVILERALGLHGKAKLPAKEVARRLGVSPSAVTQRARKIQEQLDALSSIRV